MCKRLRGHRQDQSGIRSACESRDRTFDLGRVAHAHGLNLNPERLRYRLDRTKLPEAALCRYIAKDCYTRDGRRDLLHEFQPFGAYAELGHDTKSSYVTAWPRNTIDETLSNWICRPREHDWYGGGDLLESCSGRCGQQPSPSPAALAETPPSGSVRPHRPRPYASA